MAEKVESFKTGGTFWFTDLSSPDAMHIFPVFMVLTFLHRAELLAFDPKDNPWGGLTTTRDAALTLLNFYIYSKSLKGLQNVFDSACARELMYPDACGGSGRGWISQGIVSYGRAHGTRETCALHTARLSCDTLVDFWSALGEETRQSLLRMKEEFIERLIAHEGGIAIRSCKGSSKLVREYLCGQGHS